MRKLKVKECCQNGECDDCFLNRMSEKFDLNTTIKSLSDSLNDSNKVIFESMPIKDKLWIALKAHDDNLVTFGKVVSRH